jgi:hypothetical protein
VQVCDLKVLSDNDTNFDHLQLAGEKRTSEDSCLCSEMQSQESQSVQVGDLKVLCYVGNNLTTPKVQDVTRTSQARQSWSQETSEDSCLSSEVQSLESQSVRVSDLKVL